MARTPPPNITPAPLPAPQRGDRATFSSRVDAFVLWLTNAVAQFAAVATNVYNNAVDAFQSATAAGNSASAAALSAASADQDAQTATMAPGTSATSVTSLAIGYGSKTLTLAQTGKLFKKGNSITIATSAAGDNWMAGPITAFDASTGVMTVNVTNLSGTGTFADWVVALSGPAGLTGLVNELRGNNIASASTVNLTNATGNLVHITGTATINTITLVSGAARRVIADGAFTLAHSATLKVPGLANLTVQVGDSFVASGDVGFTQITDFQRASGLPVAGGVLSREYLSPNQTIVPNSDLTLAHGLAVRPKIILPFLRCTSAATVAGVAHAAGDVVPVNSQPMASTVGCSIKADATNISVSIKSNGFDIYTAGNFQLFIEAFA